MKNSPSAQAVTTIKVQTKNGASVVDTGFGQVTFVPRDLPTGFGGLSP